MHWIDATLSHDATGVKHKDTSFKTWNDLNSKSRIESLKMLMDR